MNTVEKIKSININEISEITELQFFGIQQRLYNKLDEGALEPENNDSWFNERMEKLQEILQELTQHEIELIAANELTFQENDDFDLSDAELENIDKVLKNPNNYTDIEIDAIFSVLDEK
jgi:predicted GTPase